MKSIKQRVAAFLLAVMMTVSGMPIEAFAAETTNSPPEEVESVLRLDNDKNKPLETENITNEEVTKPEDSSSTTQDKPAIKEDAPEETEELDISEDKTSEDMDKQTAGEYTGPAYNSVTSSDGKVQIRNFEVFWASTDEDTIVNNVGSVSDYPKTYPKVKFETEPKMQINWALSGEVQYPKGAMTISIPDMQLEDDNDLKYTFKSYSIPEAKLKEDGSIDFDANYGNATLAYYYDKEEQTTKLVNILDLAPGASGTFTLTYGGMNGNYQYVKDMSKMFTNPNIELNYKNEVLKTKDKKLYIQTNTNAKVIVSKYGDQIYKTWQDKWGDDAKPNKPDDYWYGVYRIKLDVYDESQTNIDIDLKDRLGKIYFYDIYGNDGWYSPGGYIADRLGSEYNQFGMKYGKVSNSEHKHSIIGITDISKDGSVKFKRVAETQEVTWPTYNINSKKRFSKKASSFSDYSGWEANVLVKIPYKELGLDKEEKSYYVRFDNGAFLTATPLDSNDKPMNSKDGANVGIYQTYVPKAEFTAPPGDEFSLDKKVRSDYYTYFGEINRGNGYFDGNDVGVVHNLFNLYDARNDLYSKRKVEWEINTSARVGNATYNEKYKNEKDPASAYGKKKIKHEVIDDYLYLGDDYQNELTAEDYNVTSVGIEELIAYNYAERKDVSKYDYVKADREEIIVPAKLYGRKSSTGKWEEIAQFDVCEYRDIRNLKPTIEGVERKGDWTINIPRGYVSVKIIYESSFAGIDIKTLVNGELLPSKRVKDYIDKSKTGRYLMDILLRNDSTYAVYNENGEMLGLQGTTKSETSVKRTLELDRRNYGVEMYHEPAHIYLRQKPMPSAQREQTLDKRFLDGFIKNNVSDKLFEVPAEVTYREVISNNNMLLNPQPEKLFHVQNSGVFYDLLPLGVTGVKDVSVSNMQFSSNNEYMYDYINKNNNLKSFDLQYRLIQNWRNTGRIMMIVKFNNVILDEAKIKQNKGLNDWLKNNRAPNVGITLHYTMIYPWDSYKDYGSKLERNLVAYESGFEKQPNDGLDDNLTNELELGYNDSNPGFRKDYDYSTERYDKVTKLFTDKEIDWMKELNPAHNEKRFLYAKDSTAMSGDTEANIGLTKHIKDERDSGFKLKTKTREGGHYQYKIRLQAAHATTVSNLIFFDSLENYAPLKADEDYGVKQWRGELESIDVNHPIMKGVDPKIYISTVPKVDIEKHNDVSDSTIWKPYKEGDDLSKVTGVAVDLRKNKDGSDFKLEQDTAINVYLNMKAPWDMKDKRIDPEAKALNAIFAKHTVSTSLDNKSNKLIYTAYTAVNLEPVETEVELKANKKHLDLEGKDIALKGDDYKFELRDSDNKVLQTKTNDKDGNITFDPIKYNSWNVGEHTYKIVEVKGNSETTAYDSHEELVKVKVERSGDSELKATINYDKDGANFTNREVEATKAKIEANKLYYGKGGAKENPKAGAFEFILKDSSGKEVAKATNDETGKVVFEELEFKPNQIGEHKYTIEEVKGKDPTIEYDKHKENVVVKVSLTEDYKLKADVVYDKDKAVFENKLKTSSLQIIKLKDKNKPFSLEEVKDNNILDSYKVPEGKLSYTLDGAEFKLYRLDSGKEVLIKDTLTTKNGITDKIDGLLAGKYKIVETKAPKGYYVAKDPLEFEITDKDAGKLIAKFINDEGIEDLPSTGGRGTKIFIGTGITLLGLMVGAMYVANKKKKQVTSK